MLGVLWFLMFQAMGCALLLRRGERFELMERLLLGSVVGSAAAIWTPVPFAFLFGFTPLAHLCAFLLGALIFAPAFFLPPKRKLSASSARDRESLFFLPILALMLALCFSLLASHTIPERNGALYSGQFSFGDMAMHLGFITSIAEQGVFPPEYSILPGVRLCYPFLCDSVSSSLLLLGTPLRPAYMLPCFFALAQVFCGFYALARRLCRQKGAAVLAFVLFFFNGGLGMLYFPGRSGLRTLLTSFYKTPTNYMDKNIRWVNVIVDMLLPQRATLFGWALLFTILLLLYRAVFEGEKTLFLPAGLLGGLLPMIHTHSYFALGLVAFCWMLASLSRDGLKKQWLLDWMAFGLPAVLLAVPQLLLWTFHSVGGNEQFLRIHLDWVNGGEENWFWFWLKNIGPMFLLAPLCFILAEHSRKAVYFPALFIFLLCELVVFQPNVYDNNKLLYVSYALLCILSADMLLTWLGKLRRRALRGAAIALLLLLCTNAAVFTIAREITSGLPRYAYELFNADAAAAAQYVRENTRPDALFLTAGNHNNPIAALTGRKVFCGCPSYLFYHGLDYAERAEAEERMLRDSAAFEALRERCGIDYVYIGDYERSLGGDCAAYLAEHYPAVFTSKRATIYRIR